MKQLKDVLNSDSLWNVIKTNSLISSLNIKDKIILELIEEIKSQIFIAFNEIKEIHLMYYESKLKENTEIDKKSIINRNLDPEIIFRMLNKEDYSEYIWNNLKPIYLSYLNMEIPC